MLYSPHPSPPPADSLTLNKYEFYVFVKDCKLSGVSAQTADSVFDLSAPSDANEPASPTSQSGGTGTTTDRSVGGKRGGAAAAGIAAAGLQHSDGDLARMEDSRELSFVHFVVALLRLASFLQPGQTQRRQAAKTYLAMYPTRNTIYTPNADASGPLSAAAGASPGPVSASSTASSAAAPSPAIIPASGSRTVRALGGATPAGSAAGTPVAGPSPAAGSQSPSLGPAVSGGIGGSASRQAASLNLGGGNVVPTAMLLSSGTLPLYLLDRPSIENALAGIADDTPAVSGDRASPVAGDDETAMWLRDTLGARAAAEEFHAAGTGGGGGGSAGGVRAGGGRQVHGVRSVQERLREAAEDEEDVSLVRLLIEATSSGAGLAQAQAKAQAKGDLALRDLMEGNAERERGRIADAKGRLGSSWVQQEWRRMRSRDDSKHGGGGPSTDRALLDSAIALMGTVGASASRDKSAAVMPSFGDLQDFGSPDTWDLSHFQLWQRFYCLVAAYLVPNAGKVNNRSFRNQYRRVDVARVFREYYRPLHRIFAHYVGLRTKREGRIAAPAITAAPSKPGAKASSSSSSSSSSSAILQATSITITEFQVFLRDLGLANNKLGLNPAAVYGLFSNIQQDSEPQSAPDNPLAAQSKGSRDILAAYLKGNSGLGAGAAAAAGKGAGEGGLLPMQMVASGDEENTVSDLIFPEFLEGVAAIACFRQPNPYASLSAKLEALLRNDIMPWGKRVLHLT